MKVNTEKLISNLNLLEAENLNILHVTANENQLSKTALSFLASKLSERYYFGSGDKDGVIDFSSYTFRGLPAIQEIVSTASSELKKMTGAGEINLNCFSGLHAMMCAILVSTEPDDTVMSIPFEDGGHSATKGIVLNLGRKHIFAKFDQNKLDIDIEASMKIFKKHKAKAFYIDISTHIKPINVRKIRKALGKKSVIIYDASHSFGLMLGQVLPSPLRDGADIVCTNTHKTFAGPQGGLIIYKNRAFGEKANFKINATLVSSVHTARLLALSVTILEYAKYGKLYAKQVLQNAKSFSKAFEKMGYKIRKDSSGSYTQNEQVHVFLPDPTKRVAYYRNLLKNNISTNFMQVLGGHAFMRIGVQEITRRGMKEKDMTSIAEFIHKALVGESVKEKVKLFNKKFSTIKYSFDKLN